ncbi:hypothetical protein GIB67_041503, partial [Kingdonia uniflora]
KPLRHASGHANECQLIGTYVHASGHTIWHASSDLNQTNDVFQQCTCPVMCQSTTENHLFVDPFWEGFLSKFESQVSMLFYILDVL